MRPREKKRDAILGHVASWGDRRTPMARITAKPARPVNALVGFAARHDRIKLAFTQFLFAEMTLDNQHGPRGQQKHQHDFAERSLVEPPVQF